MLFWLYQKMREAGVTFDVNWLKWLLLSFKGRINRKVYILAIIAILASTYVAAEALALIPGLGASPSATAPGVAASFRAVLGDRVADMIVSPIACYLWFAASAKRMHDIGASAKWLAPTLVFSLLLEAAASFGSTPDTVRDGVVLMLAMIAGSAMLAVVCLQQGALIFRPSAGPNRYGDVQPPQISDASPDATLRREGSEMTAANLVRLFFQLDGRIGRSDWWQGVLLLTLASATLATAVAFASAAPEIPTHREISLWMSALGLPLLYPSLCLHVKRLHDVGLSGWWVLAATVMGAMTPLASLAGYTAGKGAWLIGGAAALGVLVLNAFFQGRDGENRYGPRPTTVLPTSR